jgi:hypothetical protein
MKFIVRSLTGEIKCTLSLDNKSTIMNLLENIIKHMQDIFFDIVYNGTILYFYDQSKLNEFFKSDEPIILTIIILNIPNKFNNLEHLIDYINNFNSINPLSLDYLVEKYNKLKNEYTESKIINIYFIINYYRYDSFCCYRHLPDHISIDIFNDKNIVLLGVKKYGKILYYASEELKNDKEIVMIAVQNRVEALEYASENLQNDREIVMTAVQNYGEALKYASKKLQNDREIVMAAVMKNEQVSRFSLNNGEALKYASERLQNDEEIKKMINN